MAVFQRRSQAAELKNGTTDGKYRKARPHTTVDNPSMGDDVVKANRASLHPWYGYGFPNTEEASMVGPAEDRARAARHSYPVADIENYGLGSN